MSEDTPPPKSIKIRLTADETRRLLDGGSILLELRLPKGFRLDATAKREARRQIADAGRKAAKSAGGQDRLVEAWNSWSYIAKAAAAGEGRNRKMEGWRLKRPEVRRRLDKALDALGVDELLRLMAVYQAACERGEHLRESRNFGYSYLDGFAERVTQAIAAGDTLWWQRTRRQPAADPNAASTQALADAYAAKFLGRPRYGLKVGTPAHEKFVAGAARLGTYAAKAGVPAAKAQADLLACAAAGWEQVYPGHLSCDHLWLVLLPQWLQRQYGDAP